MSQTSTTSDLFLAIDQGGQSSRVAVYTASGEQVCSFSAPCATQHHQVEGSAYPYIEQDGEKILSSIRECLQKIERQLGDDLTRIKAASFAGQGSSLLCWDNQTGEALTPVLSWQDIRGEPYLQAIPLNNEQSQQLTGLRLSPHYGATKMRWCLEHNARVAQAQQQNRLSIGPIVSYLFWHLLDQHKINKKALVDPGHAQRTLLWNLQRNEWDKTLLDIFGIPQSVLPVCRYHNSHFGTFTFGKGHSIPFTATARDQGASLFARGLPEPNTCYINIGTGAFIQRLSSKLNAPEGLLISPLWFPYQSGFNQTTAENVEVSSPTCYANEFATDELHKPLYAWEATVNGAAAAISFMQQQTGLQIRPQEMEQALALTPEKDCYLLNAVGGLSAPYWRTDLQSQFSENLSAHEKILAWIESVIFQIVINVQLMNALGETKKIIISGGFSKSDAVCQKIADLTNAQVHRSNNPDATVQGAACMAAGIPQTWQPKFSDDVFSPQNNPELIQRFVKWERVMEEWL